MSNKEQVDKIHHTVLIVIFIAALSLPMLITFWKGTGGGLDSDEKRKLAEFPSIKLSGEGINKFPVEFTKYFDDNFGVREKLIRINSYIKAFLLGISPTGKAIIGKQGWLFLGDGNIIADYRHTHPFTLDELKQWRDVLEAKRDWLAARGIKYLFVVAPNKNSIYPEFMPDQYIQVRPDSCLDQLITFLKANSHIEILDLRPTLKAEKINTRLYFKTDTHWNERGAFLGYQEIMGRLSLMMAEMKSLTLGDFNPVIEVGEGHDLANMMGLRTAMSEKIFRLEPKFTRCSHAVPFNLSSSYKWPEYPPGHEAYARECGRGKFNAVFFQDSFGTALAPLVSEHFNRTVYIWDYPNFDVMDAAIKQEHPDVVIEERVERHLKPMMPDFDVPSDMVRILLGSWVIDNKKVEIRPLSSSSVYVVNEFGSQAKCIIKNSKLFVNAWHLTGELSEDQKTITWDNASSWKRK